MARSSTSYKPGQSGNEGNIEHGFYAIVQGVKSEETEQALQAIEDEVETKDGRRAMLKRHLGLISIGLYTGMEYIIEQRSAGIPLDELPLYRNIIAYFNSWIKHSKYMDELEPEPTAPKWANEMERMKSIIDGSSEMEAGSGLDNTE